MTNITKLSNSQIIGLYSEAIKELKRREIIRIKNITGELGEYMAVEYYKSNTSFPSLQFAPPCTENIYAISVKGERYSIKTISNNGVIGVFDGLPAKESDEIPKQKFEYVIIVKLTNDFELERIIELIWDEFLENKQWHMQNASLEFTVFKKINK